MIKSNDEQMMWIETGSPNAIRAQEECGGKTLGLLKNHSNFQKLNAKIPS
jgi:hypothetical protein